MKATAKSKTRASTKARQAQIQFQEMAFVLVGLILFFGLILIFFSIYQSARIKELAETTRREETISKIQSIANSPEFACREAYCVDEEKLLGFAALDASKKQRYEKMWEGAKIVLIAFERIWPQKKQALCNERNPPPDCTIHVIYNKTAGKNWESHSIFVPLCHYLSQTSSSGLSGYRCTIGKAVVAFETTK
ncbi:MAG: hypothetical protein QXE64_01840 [Candidatus Pacearchaeota archaeon]